MSDLLSRFPQPDPAISARVIEGEAVILTMHDKTLRVLNEVGTRIWQLIDGRRTGEDILSTITDEYDVDASRAREDLKNFLEDLSKVGIVVLADEPYRDEEVSGSDNE